MSKEAERRWNLQVCSCWKRQFAWRSEAN